MSELAVTLTLGAILIAAVYGLDLIATRAEGGGSGRRVANVTLATFASISGVLLLLGLSGAAIGLARGDVPATGSVLLAALGVTGALALWPFSRSLVARLLPLDAGSLRDTLGLLIILWVVILRLGQYAAGEGEAEFEAGGIPVSALIVQAVIFIGVSLAAIGLYTRRSPREAIQRLGLRRPTTQTVLAGAALVIPMLVAATLALVATEAIRPGTSDELADTLERMAGQDPGFGFALAIAITASTGEELLFRGAIQPRYGLIFTALVFALLHVQYDLLLNLLSLVPAGIILGLERRYLGTTACIVTHAVYNLLAVLNS